MACVQIVGAGPGDPDLLTVKALRAIEKATVILHDNLVSDAILDLNKTAEKIYVGRKFGDCTCQEKRQENINQLLSKYFHTGQKVVRLKSGDPYIYGRAAEEARFLLCKKIPFEVIPGITASLAAASLNNIPITERRKSNAMMICTAHTADYSFEQLNGIATMLKAGNTLALYMGLKSLYKIIPKLLEVCQCPDIPITAVSCVSYANETLLTATLGTVQAKIKTVILPMPVVFLIGVTPITY